MAGRDIQATWLMTTVGGFAGGVARNGSEHGGLSLEMISRDRSQCRIKHTLSMGAAEVCPHTRYHIVPEGGHKALCPPSVTVAQPSRVVLTDQQTGPLHTGSPTRAPRPARAHSTIVGLTHGGQRAHGTTRIHGDKPTEEVQGQIAWIYSAGTAQLSVASAGESGVLEALTQR